MTDETIGEDGTPTRDPWQEFASLVLGDDYDPPPDAERSIYDGLDPADQFALVLHLAGGGRLGVPDIRPRPAT